MLRLNMLSYSKSPSSAGCRLILLAQCPALWSAWCISNLWSFPCYQLCITGVAAFLRTSYTLHSSSSFTDHSSNSLLSISSHILSASQVAHCVPSCLQNLDNLSPGWFLSGEPVDDRLSLVHYLMLWLQYPANGKSLVHPQEPQPWSRIKPFILQVGWQ